MVMLYMPKPDLPESLGWIHEASDWYLSTSLSFGDDIVAQSTADTANLLSITLDYDLSPDVQYYAKSRVICNKSIFESEVSIIKVSDFVKISYKHPIPSMVMVPTISLDYDTLNTPATMFTATGTPMSSTSNSVHESTSRIIETTDGRVVFSDLYNKDELTTKLMDDVLLKDNEVYILKTIYHSSSDDSSELASTVFHVKGHDEIVLTSQSIDLLSQQDVAISIRDIDNFKNMKLELFAAGMGDSKKIHEVTTDTLTKAIPSEVFDGIKTRNFLLGITVTRTDNTIIGTKYFKIETQ